MAHILFGVSGQGSGHSYRSKEIIDHLESSGHTVQVISYKKGYKNLKPFFKVTEVVGPVLIYKNNRLQYFKTAFTNILESPGLRKSYKKVKELAKKQKPDIIITDFEPLSSLYGYLHNIPVISIDNQHQITNTKISYPIRYKKDATAARVITKLMTYGANEYIITSFFETEITKPHTYLVPPIVGKDVQELETEEKPFTFVYVTSQFDKLIPILHKINRTFVVYGFNAEKKDKNIIFKPPSRGEFLQDLSRCDSIIANAGLTLISEALYLKKPFCAIPVRGQFEQILNAYYLEKLGYGTMITRIKKDYIENFLSQKSSFASNLSQYSQQNNSGFFIQLNSLLKKHIS